MAMEHKAFLFNTAEFTKQLSTIIITAGTTNNEKSLVCFINENLNKLKSPYSGEKLNIEWKEELEAKDIQELADFAMTKYYNADDELGLSYLWDQFLKSFDKLQLNYNPEYYVIGKPLESKQFVLDPGRMGLGFIYSEHISSMYNELVSLQSNFINVCEENNFDRELISAFDDLIEIYKKADRLNYGLLITF